MPAADILVVDDNSPDGTGEIAEKLALTDGQVHVLHRTHKAGLGAAYLAGFAWALDRGYGVLVEMDADGSHDPAELPDLLGALANADLVIGSRWVRGGTVRNWPRSRAILSRGGNAYARIMLGLPVHDATGGYRAYRAETLRRIGLDDVRSQGYCFQIELTLRTVRAGLSVGRGADHLYRAHTWSKQDEPRHRGRGSLASNAVVGDPPVSQTSLGALAVPGPGLGRLRLPLAPDDRQPLGQDLLEVGHAAALHQHVPVAARRLDLLRRRHVTSGRDRQCAANPAFPVNRQFRLS